MYQPSDFCGVKVLRHADQLPKEKGLELGQPVGTAKAELVFILGDALKPLFTEYGPFPFSSLSFFPN